MYRTRECRSPVNCTDSTAAAVEQETWRGSRDIAKELGLSQLRALQYFMTNSCSHITTRGEHICRQMIVLSGCNFANADKLSLHNNMLQTKHILRVKMCSMSIIFTSGKGISHKLSQNVIFKPIQSHSLGGNHHGHSPGSLGEVANISCNEVLHRALDLCGLFDTQTMVNLNQTLNFDRQDS
jgi:hypothetical protein